MKTKNDLKLGYAVKNSKTSAYLYGNKNIVRMSDNDEQHITVFVFRHVPRHDNGPDHIYYTDPRQGGYDVPSELLRMVENSAAAAALGSSKSDKKTASSRENGRKGGRPSAKTLRIKSLTEYIQHLESGEYIVEIGIKDEAITLAKKEIEILTAQKGEK